MNTIIKNLRLKNNLSCEEMANLIGVSKASYSKKENGLVKFSLVEAKVVADIFKKSIEEIFFNSEVTENETTKIS
ncbi:helix-turn-helix transcriptional regulator [Clostridium tyrobutyricum]|uniref:helix-turn-helix transcriptional regulator n=1 Tax=Clostridium tyrobutyricum TaxID=1519 RepID=UPI0011C82E1A|nr:helix-turn-helix domain-containing protein [Clostridium tyrobutyricum]